MRGLPENPHRTNGNRCVTCAVTTMDKLMPLTECEVCRIRECAFNEGQQSLIDAGWKSPVEAEELLEALFGMVNQHCQINNNPYEYDSLALSDNAIAMRLLAMYGKLKITHEVGKRVLATDSHGE